MTEINYPGERADEVRRKVGEELLGFLTYRGVIDPPEEVPGEEPTEGPSFRQQLEAAKYEREQALAQLFMASMGSALQPESDTQTDAFFGPAATERKRDRDEQGRPAPAIWSSSTAS